MQVRSRHFLSSKDIRNLKQEILKTYPQLNSVLDLKNSRIEVITLTCNVKLYVVNNRVELITVDDKLIPSISLLNRGLDIPSITVDMGAVPFIIKGADVMLPGIVACSDRVSKGSIVKIIDEKHGKAIAVGEALIPLEDFKTGGKGRAVRILHYVGDKIWGLTLSLNLNNS
ncbi:MAG: DUF1947 domain-containing protein [Candidatus Odinarchaeota archaeon]